MNRVQRITTVRSATVNPESKMFNSCLLRPKVILINIEYDATENRVVKSFKDNSSARRFYLKMSKENRNPKIVKAELN